MIHECMEEQGLFFSKKEKLVFPTLFQESQLGLRKKKLHEPAEQPGKKNNLDSKNIQCQRKALDAYAWKSSLLSDLEIS